MIKKCGICGKAFETITGGQTRRYCFECVPSDLDIGKRTVQKRKSAKEVAVKMLGGCCEKCGETRKHILSFHHLGDKDGSPSQLLASSKIKEFFTEVFKSILLCNNCHGDFHYLNNENGITLEEYLGKEVPHYVDNRDEIFNKTKEAFGEKQEEKIEKEKIEKKEKTIFCIKCGKKLGKGNKTGICWKCIEKERNPKGKPDREELKELIRSLPFTKIGEMYGISDNAVRKWCDSYNLPRKSTEIKLISDEDWKDI